MRYSGEQLREASAWRILGDVLRRLQAEGSGKTAKDILTQYILAQHSTTLERYQLYRLR